MDTLKHGDSGLSVEQLQTALNLAGLTRLPRITVDGQFNALTVGRVMEFQSFSGLTVDGVVGPQTDGRLSHAPAENQQSPSSPTGRSILADLYGRVLHAYDQGISALQISPISSGRPGFRSTPGMFQMTSRRLRRHSSSEFPGKDNMDFLCSIMTAKRFTRVIPVFSRTGASMSPLHTRSSYSIGPAAAISG